jgi:hypothetical protein
MEGFLMKSGKNYDPECWANQWAWIPDQTGFIDFGHLCLYAHEKATFSPRFLKPESTVPVC